MTAYNALSTDSDSETLVVVNYLTSVSCFCIAASSVIIDIIPKSLTVFSKHDYRTVV